MATPYKKVVVGLLAVGMIASVTVYPMMASAASGSVTLKRDEVYDRAVEYSPTIKTLETTRENIRIDAKPFVSMVKGVLEDMANTIEVTESAVGNGAIKLYDGVLLLEEYAELQKQSYELAKRSYEITQIKKDKDLVSEVELEKAKNNMAIEALKVDQLNRQVENMKMSFNAMVGLDVTVDTQLSDPEISIYDYEDVEYYVEKGLEERIDAISAKEDLQDKRDELGNLPKYLTSSSDEYKELSNEVWKLDYEYQQTIKEVEMDIRDAYYKLVDKDKNRQIKKLSLEDMEKGMEDMVARYEAGYITLDTINQFEVGLNSAINAYYSANREYLEAVATLEQSSSKGPGQSSGTGGK